MAGFFHSISHGLLALSHKRLTGFERYKFVARLEARTCGVCGKLDGQVFPVADMTPGKNAEPMHPWCMCTTMPLDEEIAALEADETRWAKDPETGKTVEVPANMTYQEWKDQYNKLHPDMPLERERDKIYRRSADEKMWKEYISIAGKDNIPKTLDDFQNLKYNKNSQHDWWLTKGYVSGVRDGHLSVLTGMDTYKSVDAGLRAEIVGKETIDGITVNGYKTHFIDRVIGNYSEKREGVPIKDVITAITTAAMIKDGVRNGVISRTYYADRSAVTINPVTGILIQTNPL